MEKKTTYGSLAKGKKKNDLRSSGQHETDRLFFYQASTQGRQTPIQPGPAHAGPSRPGPSRPGPARSLLFGLVFLFVVREHLGHRAQDKVTPVPLQQRQRQVAGGEEADNSSVVHGARLEDTAPS